MKMQKHWYLGFIGIVGLYKLPGVLGYFQGAGTVWDVANVLWLLWFLYLLPEDREQGAA